MQRVVINHDQFVQTSGDRLDRRLQPAIPNTSDQRVPAAMAGAAAYSVLQVDPLATSPGQDLSATDQAFGARYGMACRTDSGLDRGSVDDGG